MVKHNELTTVKQMSWSVFDIVLYKHNSVHLDTMLSVSTWLLSSVLEVNGEWV